MPRSGMTALIARLRKMADDSRQPQQFTDDDLQDFLDQHRLRLAGEPLKADWQEDPSPRYFQQNFWDWPSWVGYQERKVWRSDYPFLDGDSVLRDSAGNTISSGGYTANLNAGTFDFATAQSMAPYLWGYAYDVNGAAWEAWTLKTANTSLWKGQFAQAADQQIKRYQRLMWARNAQMHRY